MKHEGNVKAKVLYECGRCGNRQTREYDAVDGLLTIPNVYCGRCIRSKNPTVMTFSFTKIEVVEPKKEIEMPDKAVNTTDSNEVETDGEENGTGETEEGV